MNTANSYEEISYGYISGINGSLLEIKGLEDHVRLHDLIKISDHEILGEVIQIYSDHIILN